MARPNIPRSCLSILFDYTKLNILNMTFPFYGVSSFYHSPVMLPHATIMTVPCVPSQALEALKRRQKDLGNTSKA